MQTPYLATEQGRVEQRIEPYRKYCEGVAQTMTQLCVKSGGQIGGFAAERTAAIWSLQ